MDVDHRRRDVRVAHVRLDVGQREGLHRQGSEGMSQVVEAQLLEPGALERRHEAPPQGRALEVFTDCVDEHEVVLAGPPIASAQAVESRGSLVNERDRPDPA
jgi:hypothetical protein